jgi:hypothetical protein
MPSAGLGGWGFARKLRVPEFCSYREDNVMLDTQCLGYMDRSGSSAQTEGCPVSSDSP